MVEAQFCHRSCDKTVALPFFVRRLCHNYQKTLKKRHRGSLGTGFKRDLEVFAEPLMLSTAGRPPACTHGLSVPLVNRPGRPLQTAT